MKLRNEFTSHKKVSGKQEDVRKELSQYLGAQGGPFVHPPLSRALLRIDCREPEEPTKLFGVNFAVSLASESARSKSGIAVLVAEYPDPNVAPTDVVKEVVRKSLEVAAPETSMIEVKIFGIRLHFANAHLELGEKVVSELERNLVVLQQNLIEIQLDSPVKPSFHGSSAPPRAHRM